MQDALSYSCHREVQDLHHAWLLANDAADNSHDQPSRNDKNLLAITQLAALKLRTQHAIVSLLDGESQHILAETTQTRSLSHGCDDIPSDFTSRLLLDAFYAKRNLANSIPSSEQGSSQEPDHFVRTDCRTDDRFKDHAFVKREGGVRFALGVPLISKNTRRIGVLLVLDGSPRRMVEDTDLLDLKDCAQCVVRHLELVHSSVRATKETNILRGIAECFPNQYQALEDQEQQGNSEDSKRSDSGAGERTVKFEDDDNTDLDDSPRSIETSFQAAFDGVARMLRDRSTADGAVIFGPPAVANLMTMEDDDTSPNEFEERCGKKPSSSLLASSLRDGVVCPAIGNLEAPPICILN